MQADQWADQDTLTRLKHYRDARRIKRNLGARSAAGFLRNRCYSLETALVVVAGKAMRGAA